jgi:branched-chain amino acid transport system permease protein
MSELLQHVINGLSLGAVYALIALGYTMVYGVLQLINFAHSEVFMLGAFAGFYAQRALPESLPAPLRLLLVLLIAMAACGAAGFVIERAAYRPLRSRPRINSLITAIGVSMLIQALGQLPWFMGPSPRFFPSLMENGPLLTIGDAGVTKVQAATFAAAVALMVGLHRLVFHTRIGTAMRAVSFDGRIAQLMGVNTDVIISFTFVLGSALAAAAGILVGMNYPRIEPTMGTMLGLKAFVAAVLGGIGNIQGAMLGGVVIGLVEALVVGYGTSSYRDAVAFGVLILILVFRPAGLLGRAVAEKV